MAPERGQVITFYSYKGGTGRTMTLANFAVLMARGRRRVLAMDWDLEAPGLHRYFEGHVKFGGRPGTIDLLEELAGLAAQAHASSKSEPLGEEDTFALVRGVVLERYIVRVDGRLGLIWAGASDADDYAQRVAEFDWSGLYRRAPYLFTCLATVLGESFGYVCVDSRTGVSDTSGVCTAVLPEKLVVVFTPNRQSLEGALSRARTAVAYRGQSGDLRPLVVYPLASRVELSEEALRRRWRDGVEGEKGYQAHFEELLSEIYALPASACDLQTWFDEVQIQQTPRYAYGEEIAAADEEATTDRLSLANSYVRFATALDDTDAPWSLTQRKTAIVSQDPAQEDVAMRRLREETAWHEARSQRQRRHLLVFRLLQGVAVATALIVGFGIGYGYQARFWEALAVGVVAVGVLEAVAAVVGATQWRRHATLARRLCDEEYRFNTHMRQYEDDASRGKVLAERVEDILIETYEEWEKQRTLFSSLASPPARSGRAGPYVDDDEAA